MFEAEFLPAKSGILKTAFKVSKGLNMADEDS